MRCPTCGLDSPPGVSCANCGGSLRDDTTTIRSSVSEAAQTIGVSAPDQSDLTVVPRAATTATQMLGPGQQFGRYHILRLLGSGGMGSVFQAWDDELGVAVALKIVRPDGASNAAAREELQRRFKQEIVLARQVTHTNVLRIHDLG